MIDPPDPSNYELLSHPEQEALCQEIRAEVASGQFRPAGEPSREHWDHVWGSCYSPAPPFIKPATVLRVNGAFVRPKDPNLETAWYVGFRERLLLKYFQDVPSIYEFGCGNGWNLVAARDLYPDKALVGLDWVKTSLDWLPWYCARWEFDFFRPDYRLLLPPGSGVLTVGALEQTGKDWEAFLAYLLANKPAICVHVEPIVEWYDPKNPVDATAIEYHLARNYWQGFPAKMRQLAGQGKVEILDQKRSFFGSRYLEGYSLNVWRVV